MVFLAQQDEVPPAGRAAVFPVHQVVDLAPAGFRSALLPLAVLVAGDDEGPQGSVDDATALADVERLAAAGVDRQDDAVAGQPPSTVGADGTGEGEPGS